MNKQNKIKAKDVRNYMRETLNLYASGDGKRFFIGLMADKLGERYLVDTNYEVKGFSRIDDAVKYYNSLGG